MSRFFRLIALSAFVVGGSASAGPLSLWMGHKQTLFITQKVTRLEVSNPAVAQVAKVKGVGLEVAARSAGVTDIRITCSDGSFYSFKVHVTAGAEVYSVNRNEPEHYQWSLSSSEQPKPAPKVARKSGKKSPRRLV